MVKNEEEKVEPSLAKCQRCLYIKHSHPHSIPLIVTALNKISNRKLELTRILESALPFDPTRERNYRSNRGADFEYIFDPKERIGSPNSNGYFVQTTEINPGVTVELIMEFSISIPS